MMHAGEDYQGLKGQKRTSDEVVMLMPGLIGCTKPLGQEVDHVTVQVYKCVLLKGSCRHVRCCWDIWAVGRNPGFLL